jgi:DNA-binding MarR family transcriptional regulator
MSNPHIDFQSAATSPSVDVLTAMETSELRTESRGRRTASSPSALLLRTAECLRALLQGPTVQAGLNESRYNVLDSLRRKPSGTCSQSELATYLLQSESNLSTLLDRMRKDGLISRVRSESDRRVALIGLSTAGRDALARADQVRQRAAAPLLRVLNEQLEAALGEALELLRRNLERTLGVTGRMRTTIDAAPAARQCDADVSSVVEEPLVNPARRRAGAPDWDGPEP